jgi:hypothetical protein
MKVGNFDLHVWNEIRLKLLRKVEDVQFHEMLLYSMDTISEMFGTGVMR